MGRASRLLPDIRKGLERFAAVDIAPTQHIGHAVDLVAAADLGAIDGVIAAGGDGTLFEVLNGLYRKEPQERVPLGLVPVGTGNAFVRDLGLMPGDWQKGIDINFSEPLQALSNIRQQSGGAAHGCMRIEN